MKQAKRYYRLKMDKYNQVLSIKQTLPGKLFWGDRGLCPEVGYYRYNESYYFSCSRKDLKDLAISIKDSWIQELQIALSLIEKIKI